MQTFLPYPDFDESARALDTKRLVKQRVECGQIHSSLVTPGYGWQNHPAVRMWHNHEYQLVQYALAICRECDRRGIFDHVNAHGKFYALAKEYLIKPEDEIGFDLSLPWWFGDSRFHESHKSNLLRKDPVFYGKYGWTCGPDLPYWWPTQQVNMNWYKVSGRTNA